MTHRGPARTIGRALEGIPTQPVVAARQGPPADLPRRRPRRGAAALAVAAVALTAAFGLVGSTGGGPGSRSSAVTVADGVVPAGTTVDDDVPAVGNLAPALRAALRDAAVEAADDGIVLGVNSGWRSARYQDRLLREAVAEYGSQREAARWVATADTSLHVSGDAVDIGPPQAATWLARHGANHGLCRVYRNEPWHFELRPGAVDGGCPAVYADPTEDPRMS